MITQPGEVVLIHHGGQPAAYARVEEILADVKPGWWQIRLLVLTVPTQEITWILREEYIDGGEFTMGGVAMRLTRLEPPRPARPPEPDPPADDQGGAKVLSLSARRSKSS
ncbi:MAG: hypothetical protein ACOZHQ_16330 [Thermodesulfobacteriota bacterium]